MIVVPQLLKTTAPRPIATSTVFMRREMKIQWVTRDAGQPQVQWGLGPDLLSSSVKGDSATYTRSDLCGEPATSVMPALFYLHWGRGGVKASPV